jgi:hypothetical protein
VPKTMPYAKRIRWTDAQRRMLAAKARANLRPGVTLPLAPCRQGCILDALLADEIERTEPEQVAVWALNKGRCAAASARVGVVLYPLGSRTIG